MQELAERLAQGEQAAWAALYEAYKRNVLGLCLGYLHNREDALDAAEETFVKALQKASYIRPDGNVRSWLLAIAANTCKDWIRKQGRGTAWLRKWLAGKRETFVAPDVAETAARDARHDAVRAAIARLEEPFRLPLLLKYYEDMDYDEIAEVLSQTEGVEIKRGTVASRLNRARAQLKALLEGGAHGG